MNQLIRNPLGLRQAARTPWAGGHGFRDLEGFFEDFLGVAPTASLGTSVFDVRSDLEELEKEYVLSADLPGLKREDFKIEFDKGVLTLSGQRKDEREEKKDGWRHVERSFGKFYRAYRVPESVDAEKIEAKFEDGVLRVRLPKSGTAQSRMIRVG